MPSKTEYIPGVCNIGPAEIQRRMQAGWLGLAAAVLLWVVFILFSVPAPWRLLLFFPAVTAAIGFLQAAMHFCAAFGILGVFNVAAAAGKTDSVEQAEFRKADRKKALLIILYSLLVGLAAAAAGFFLAPPK
jgi:glucan phosphoethanolaminetransferase (alkaline phosphatase superfamily)